MAPCRVAAERYPQYRSFGLHMSRNKSKHSQTDIGIIVSNLRSEIGEIITSWLLYRDFLESSNQMKTDNIIKDISNPDLNKVRLIIDKFENDIVSRLSELAGKTFGRTNFFFATHKLSVLHKEAKDFDIFIEGNKFRDKRNKSISHKEIPVRWQDFRAETPIGYTQLLRAIAKALQLMKKIDDHYLGPQAKYHWIEMRKRRRDFSLPGKVSYGAMPYFRLTNENRLKILMEEERSGKVVWEDIHTKLNGVPSTIKACKAWGIVIINNRFLVLEHYPLIEIKEINVN
ncbi:hypothetical protein F9K33_16390 [bacterium]|nr:MAG: hypothetical protein F9K33_16390 [bacterium]